MLGTQIPTKVLVAALLCVSKTKPANAGISCIMFDPEGFIVATDGMVMFTSSWAPPTGFTSEAIYLIDKLPSDLTLPYLPLVFTDDELKILDKTYPKVTAQYINYRAVLKSFIPQINVNYGNVGVKSSMLNKVTKVSKALGGKTELDLMIELPVKNTHPMRIQFEPIDPVVRNCCMLVMPKSTKSFGC